MSLIRLINFIEKNKVGSTEKYVANVIINSSWNIVNQKAKDIAMKAHTTHSVVSKLIKKVGFKSWNDFLTSTLFEEKVKSFNYNDDLNDKINLEIENVRLFLKTKARTIMQKIASTFLNKEYNFVFFGKRLTGNVAQYVTWNFTSEGLTGTHTYFLDELWGLINQKSVLVAFCLEELNQDFLEAISKSRVLGTQIISIIIGKSEKVAQISHLSLQIPPMGYFKNDPHWHIIQNEVLRYVGLKLFEMWHKTLVLKN